MTTAKYKIKRRSEIRALEVRVNMLCDEIVKRYKNLERMEYRVSELASEIRRKKKLLNK